MIKAVLQNTLFLSIGINSLTVCATFDIVVMVSAHEERCAKVSSSCAQVVQ